MQMHKKGYKKKDMTAHEILGIKNIDLGLQSKHSNFNLATINAAFSRKNSLQIKTYESLQIKTYFTQWFVSLRATKVV